jgi:hypothetical protein
MSKVRVSAVRIRSLLANRNMDADALALRATTSVHPRDLVGSDQAVEYEDLVKLAKVFARPWSYLLIDAAEVYPDAGSDNRTYANRRVSLSPELLAELQMADVVLDAAADLFPGAGYQTPLVPSGGWPTVALRSSTTRDCGCRCCRDSEARVTRRPTTARASTRRCSSTSTGPAAWPPRCFRPARGAVAL